MTLGSNRKKKAAAKLEDLSRQQQLAVELKEKRLKSKEHQALAKEKKEFEKEVDFKQKKVSSQRVLEFSCVFDPTSAVFDSQCRLATFHMNS